MKPPKLVAIIVIDQFPADALTRFKPYLRGGGLTALLDDGALFSQAFYKHATTATGPGHALIGSGQYGRTTGIVGNDWVDTATGGHVYCVEDKTVTPSTPTAKPMGPRLFEGRSLAQRVKKRWPKARVVGVAIKDRSAILTVGAGADAAYWFDTKARGFVTSSAFPSHPKPLDFNNGLADFMKDRTVWDYSIKTPTAAVCPADRDEWHQDAQGLQPGFPHPVKDVNAALRTPYGNELLELFAEEVGKDYLLGRNQKDSPDVLVVSFSAYDYIGHAYGPDSCEIADATARLDQTLDRFLQFLQQLTPASELVVVLTGDHGSAPIPELVKASGQDAGRFDLYDRSTHTFAAMSPLRRMIEQGAAANFEYVTTDTGPFITMGFEEPCLYLDPKGPARGREERVRAWMKGFIGVQDGVQSVHTREEFEAKRAPESLALAWRKDRAGDVCLILKPHWMWDNYGKGTNHGQPWDYDAHVPLILWGSGITGGDYLERVSPAQIAPTVASFLDLPMDGFAEPKPLLKRGLPKR